MKKQPYEIDMKDGTKQTVEGIIIGDIWGIDKRTLKTVTYTKKGDKRTLSSSAFFLTHLPTGKLVTSSKTQKALKELVNRPGMVLQEDVSKMAKEVSDFWNSRKWS